MKINIIHTKLRGYFLIVILITTANLAFCQRPATNCDRKPIINLSLNENPFGPSKGVKDSILKELPNLFRYAASDGEEFLRQVAIHEGVNTEQIIPGEILELLGVYLGIKGGAGSEFIYTVPGYPALVNAAASVGGKVISVPLNDKLENDLKSIEALVNDKTQAVFLVNPHNPSGTVTEKKLFFDFVKRISKRTLVVVDEAYLEYADDFAGRTAVNNLKDGDNVIIFRTMAKAYGLAGLSIGYAVAPKELALYLKTKGLGDTHALNRLSVVATEVAIKNQENIAQVNKLVTLEREKWHVFLDELGLQHTASKANFVFFDTKKPYAEIQKRLAAAGILIGREFTPYNTWVRISIGLPEENTKVQAVIKEIVRQ